jgi:hypothetical protein
MFHHAAANDTSADQTDIELFRFAHGRIRAQSVAAVGRFV